VEVIANNWFRATQTHGPDSTRAVIPSLSLKETPACDGKTTAMDVVILRLEPTGDQKTILREMAGAARFVYNSFLSAAGKREKSFRPAREEEEKKVWGSFTAAYEEQASKSGRWSARGTFNPVLTTMVNTVYPFLQKTPVEVLRGAAKDLANAEKNRWLDFPLTGKPKGRCLSLLFTFLLLWMTFLLADFLSFFL
jgi:hypothetical protein